ncbi:hypothetical protein C1646_822254 [Rhizophagus diaphanus]|nr:hypothetical protein C1646_822254 [Rhizophagus diaphanus] [Rhizophagus sp. MUCL 43196]
MQQLSVPSTSIDTEISLTPPVIDKKQQFSVTAECIVYIFRKAVHSGYEEILHWYGFAEIYDKRINEIRTINKIKINTAKQQVYQEVKKLLPDISDVNLGQQLSRAKKLYKLFNAVGVKKIKQVTYSANAISNLNNTQIQNIIDYVISKAITGNHQTPKNNLINALEAQEECSCENFDYYGITDETSCGDYICSLCKLGHDDKEIEGLYEKKGFKLFADI